MKIKLIATALAASLIVATQAQAHHSFSAEFDADKNESLLGMPEDSDWVLYAPNGFEPVLIHNPFMHQLSRDIGRYSSRTRFVEVYMSTSGASPVTVTVSWTVDGDICTSSVTV